MPLPRRLFAHPVSRQSCPGAAAARLRGGTGPSRPRCDAPTPGLRLGTISRPSRASSKFDDFMTSPLCGSLTSTSRPAARLLERERSRPRGGGERRRRRRGGEAADRGADNGSNLRQAAAGCCSCCCCCCGSAAADCGARDLLSLPTRCLGGGGEDVGLHARLPTEAPPRKASLSHTKPRPLPTAPTPPPPCSPPPPREGRTEAPVGTPQFPSPLGGGRTEAYPVGPALSLA